MTAPTNSGPKIGLEKRILPRRFYTATSVASDGGAWSLLLDGRKAKTPGKHPLSAPSERIAERLLAEWADQVDVIDPATMPLTTLACTAIDAVAAQPGPVADEIVKYAGTDLLCYRADAPEGLIAAEAAAWDPLLDWAARDLGAVFVLSSGLTHVTQPPSVATAITRAIGDRHPLSLAALHVLTTLTGSTILALAVDRGRLSIDDAWRAAHVDEDWQIARWGEDAEAMARRANRFKDASAAAFVLDALRP